MVVEDEPALLQHLARAIGVAAYAVDCIADGDQADFLVRTESYDAVVLDLGFRASTASRPSATGATPDSPVRCWC